MPRHGLFTPEMTWYPLYRRLGGPNGRSGGCGKSCAQRDSIPGPYNPQRVAIPSTLSWPSIIFQSHDYFLGDGVCHRIFAHYKGM
jgi:hypothetical protein